MNTIAIEHSSVRAVRAALEALLLLPGCDRGVASVDGRIITREQFDAFLAERRMQGEGVLDAFLEREALADAIEEQGLDPRTQAELNELKKDLLINRYFERFLAQSVSDEDVARYYDEHKSEFEEREIHPAHILIRTRKRMQPVEREAQRTKAFEAYSKVHSGLLDFKAAAKQYSDDRQTAERGGDLGWLNLQGLDPVFAERARGLEPNQVSEPFESAFGFHVLQVLEPTRTVTRPLAAVSGLIRQKLGTEAKRVERARLLESVPIEKRVP